MLPDGWADVAELRAEVTRLKARCDALRRQLEAVEWSSPTWGLGYKCPVCGGLQTKQEDRPVGHKRGCALAAALEDRPCD